MSYIYASKLPTHIRDNVSLNYIMIWENKTDKVISMSYYNRWLVLSKFNINWWILTIFSIDNMIDA